MIHLTRDPTCDMARLRCDRCRRAGSILLFGEPRIPLDGGGFAWLRRMEASGAAWRCLESGDEPGLVTDLCRRCWRAVLRGDDTPRPRTRGS